jgi:hypothetical protein
MGFLDDAVQRQRERRDPLGRLPWPVRLLGLVLLTALALAQVVLGGGASRVLGLVLLLLVVPAQAVGTIAAYRVAKQDRQQG